MPINYEQMMQSKSTGLEARYGDREVMLYALGIGFQRDPMNEQELPFTYENDLQVVPTLATVIPLRTRPGGDGGNRSTSGVNSLTVVRGRQPAHISKARPCR